MDPLSITVSVVTLIQVATSLTKTFRGFKHSIKTIDTRIEELCDELESLTACLNTVQETVDDCQRLAVPPVEEALWQQCDVAMKDCYATLSAMKDMAERITGTEKSRGFLRRTKAVVNWNEHSTDLASFRDKLHKSHLALQTMLQTISVSISLRNHDSIDLVHLKLDVLKRSIDDALGAALRPPAAGGLSYSTSDIRFTTNLRALLEEAKHFHSAASSTASTRASTIHDGTNGPWMARSHSDQAISVMGDFPHTRRQWVENYVRAGRHQKYQSPDSSGQQSPHRAVSPRRPQSPTGGHLVTSFAAVDSITAKEPENVTPKDKEGKEDEGEGYNASDSDSDPDYSDSSDEDDSSEAEAERASFQYRLHELAMDRIKSSDYVRAVDFLQRALKTESSTDLAKASRRQLQIQLALCHFLQGDWKQAEVIVSELSKVKSDRDSVVCTLLHILSLAYLFHYSFDSALNSAQQALKGRKRLVRNGCIDNAGEVDEALMLLATIHDVRGGEDDYIHADVFTGQVTEGFEYHHPTSERAFITGHPTLLSTVFGVKNSEFGTTMSAEVAGSLSISHQWILPPRRQPTVDEGASPLSTKATDYWRYEEDTMKCAISLPMPATMPLSPEATVADDDVLTTIDTPTSPIKDRLARLITPKRTRPNSLEHAPGAAGSPSSTASPISRWRKGGSAFVHTKSKNLLRKRSAYNLQNYHKRPRAFGLLSKIGIHQTEETDDRILDWVRGQPVDRNATENGPWRPSRGLRNNKSDQYPSSVRCNSSCTSFGVTTAFAEPVATGGPCYLHHPDGIFGAARPRRNACVAASGHELGHEMMDSSLCHELDACPIYEMADNPPPRDETLIRHSLFLHSTGEISYFAPFDAQLQDIIQEAGAATTSSASCRPRARLVPSPPTLPGSSTSAVESVTGKLAGLFAALPQATEGDERHAIMLQLGRLLPQVASVCNDPILADDIQRTIRTLVNNGSAVADDASDSGYSTMATTGSTSSASEPDPGAPLGHDNSVSSLIEGGLLKPEAERCRLSTEDQEPPVLMNGSYNQGSTSPALKRAYSFVVGAEDQLDQPRSGTREKYEEDTAESKKKLASFVLRENPPG